MNSFGPRVLDIAVPFARANSATKRNAGIWPARWIGVDTRGKASVRAFRCRFSVEAEQTIRVHVTADNRYELFLDSERIGRGSERGDARHWFFESYDLLLSEGEHTIVARVWWLPAPQTPFAQHSVHPGFLLCPDDENFASLLATGVASWDIKELNSYSFTDPQTAWGTGDNVVIDGTSFAWNFERGNGDEWQRAETKASRAATLDFAGINAGHANNAQGVHELRPATLLPQLDILRHIGRVVTVAEIASLKTCDVPIRENDNLSDEHAKWQKLLS